MQLKDPWPSAPTGLGRLPRRDLRALPALPKAKHAGSKKLSAAALAGWTLLLPDR
jgi:hypothetical protein